MRYPFQPGEASCELCCQGFANARSFKRTHSGDTGYSWEDCSKVLTSRVMPDLHLQSRGQEMQLHCTECGRVTQPNKLWWLILGLGMGLSCSWIVDVCIVCRKGFQSAEDHEETHGLSQGAFSMLGGWLHCWSLVLLLG